MSETETDLADISSGPEPVLAVGSAFGKSSARGKGKVKRQSNPSKNNRGSAKSEGKIYDKVHDRHEEYTYVTRDDLREVWSLGWLQQGLTTAGTFFFSGAFWLLIELIVRQSESTEGFKLTAWMFVCFISMMAGAILAGVGLYLFSMKQRRISKYFPDETSD